ncbi:MAG: N-acetylmuramoyl-L-alanine amidase family protein [Suipraeoptans sp.]
MNRQSGKRSNNNRINFRNRRMQNYIKIGIVVLLAVLIGLIVYTVVSGNNQYSEIESAQVDASKPDIDVQLLEPNAYSRPQTETEKIKNIVIHYTANPGSTAMDNRNYFNGLKDSKKTQASSNFVVGLDGEIVQCVPTWEVAYASNDRNIDSISIEFCHEDKTGIPNNSTYSSLVQLCAWLCMKFDLTSEDIIRHYDITGKICPKYFVDNEEAFEQFKGDVQDAIERGDSSQ